MFLPLALIRNLQMHWKRKLTVATLFCLGWVCIATATVRAAYLGSDVAQRVAGGSKFKVPSPPWLALWAMVEAAVGKSTRQFPHILIRITNDHRFRIAIIIACGPGLYREIKVIQSTRKGYDDNGYQHRSGTGPYYQQGRSGRSGRSAHDDDDDNDLNLGDYPRATTRIMNESSSQEELVHGESGKLDKIVVTRSVLVSGNDKDGS